MASTSSLPKVALVTGASSRMGKLGRPLVFIRKYFGDRVFDMAIMSQAK